MNKVVDITPFRRSQIEWQDAVADMDRAIARIKEAKETQNSFLLWAGLEEADAAMRKLRLFRRHR